MAKDLLIPTAKHYPEASCAISWETKQPSLLSLIIHLLTELCPAHVRFLSCPVLYNTALILKRGPGYNSIFEPKANSYYRRMKEPRRL